MNVRKLLSVFLFLLILSMFPPIVSGGKLSIVATADSYTESDGPNLNYGGASSLYSYYYEYEFFDETTSYECHTWLKFDLSRTPTYAEATVSSIILRVRTFFTTTTNRVGVFVCPNTAWREMELTWNNCPEVTGQPIDTVYVGSSDTDYDFDVTSAVKGKSAVTLVLKTLEPTGVADWANFLSKEYALSDYHPRLVVEYTMTSTPLDSTLLTATSIVIIAVVILVGYAVVKKRKQPSHPTSPSVPSSNLRARET